MMLAHLYFGYFSTLSLPLIEKLLISSVANILLLFLMYLVSALT